jgi:NAD(P)-dependent dehydrogenase (short-subunit alcohol dehydrogenase family)
MSGLGRGLAEAYVRRGAHVAVFDLVTDDAVLHELRQFATTADQQIAAFAVDVTDAKAIMDAAAAAVTAIGAPQLAINSAGIQRAQPFGELPAADFNSVVQVNLVGSRNFAASVLPHMASGSRLALVSSMAGFAANYSYAAYCASKFGVIGLGRVLRLEYCPCGIGVSLICPPEVDTPMVVEEQKHMHPVSRRLKDIGGSLSLPEALTGILAGLDAGKNMIIPGTKAKLTYFCNRYLPDFLMNALVDYIVRDEMGRIDGVSKAEGQ